MTPRRARLTRGLRPEVTSVLMLTIATFNCENLFSRPTLLNFETEAAPADLLRKVAALEETLAKPERTHHDAG